MDAQLQEADKLQRAVARLVAASPVGVRLLLIGGFRYRLLDDSQRFSVDIDYHWDGDLDQKQDELQRFCQRVVLNEVKRSSGYEGSASKRTGPDAESQNAAFIDLRFWKPDRSIEIPIEITRIICLDRPTIRTAHGMVYPTPSDADVIEGKVLAILNRVYLQHRDFIDLFLFANTVRSDSADRIGRKISKLALSLESIQKRLADLEHYSDYHAKAIEQVIDTQVETTVAMQLKAGGGGRTVLAESLKLLTGLCRS